PPTALTHKFSENTIHGRYGLPNLFSKIHFLIYRLIKLISFIQIMKSFIKEKANNLNPTILQ
ncbi:MAG TPA: hypothetical protein PLB54_02680, partial [Nitrosomonas sp.]|nr:hypothetical protein [Nitrosomonas sp.]